MKTYTFTCNSGLYRGTATIEANTKREAIELAKAKFPYHGVNASSFKVKK